MVSLLDGCSWDRFKNLQDISNIGGVVRAVEADLILWTSNHANHFAVDRAKRRWEKRGAHVEGGWVVEERYITSARP